PLSYGTGTRGRRRPRGGSGRARAHSHESQGIPGASDRPTLGGAGRGGASPGVRPSGSGAVAVGVALARSPSRCVNPALPGETRPDIRTYRCACLNACEPRLTLPTPCSSRPGALLASADLAVAAGDARADGAQHLKVDGASPEAARARPSRPDS